MKSTEKSRWWQEALYLVKFALVGLLNTALTAVVMSLLALTGMADAVYAAIGYVVGMACSFLLNFRYTFQSESRDRLAKLLKFVGVGLGMLVVAEVVQYTAKTWLSWPEVSAVAAGMVVYTGGGFLLNRFWVFSNRSAS